MSKSNPKNIFNIGIDCEDIQRWRKMLPKLKSGPHRGLFTEREHRYCNSFKDPAPHYAVRWCAKEAVVKAFSPFYDLDIRKIEVIAGNNGAPSIKLYDVQLNKINPVLKISLSHSTTTAVAIALINVDQ